ncbi:hypothetical protein F4782DRAFT_533565 [Xylaria castorea]|nr:hypothetical protein F4782DRAFT_533565 [Xylaria castorea]
MSLMSTMQTFSALTLLTRRPYLDSRLRVTEGRILDPATESFPFVPEDAAELADHAVAKEDFVAFIDNPNINITSYVAFSMLEVAGFAFGLVPYDVAEGVGGAGEAIKIVATASLNDTHTKNYIVAISEKRFHPRKFHIKIIDVERFRKLLGLDKKDSCLPALTEATPELTCQQRCL